MAASVISRVIAHKEVVMVAALAEVMAVVAPVVDRPVTHAAGSVRNNCHWDVLCHDLTLSQVI